MYGDQFGEFVYGYWDLRKHHAWLVSWGNDVDLGRK